MTDIAGVEVRECPHCRTSGPVSELFGYRRQKVKRADGSVETVEQPQSWCRDCRKGVPVDGPSVVRTERRALGLTQTQLADALGVSQGMVSRWERGRATPEAAHLAALAALAQPTSTDPKNVGYVEAARILLREAGVPVHYRELTQRAVDRGLVVTSGKTPEMTMHAMLGRLMKEPDPEFTRPERGYWALTSSPPSHVQLELTAVDGTPLDATATMEDGAVVLESRGPDRNTQYAEGLLAILRRLHAGGASIEAIALARANQRGVGPLLDVAGHPFPIRLRDVPDLKALRKLVSKAIAATRRKPGAKGSGNSTKRIRITFSGTLGAPDTPAPQETSRMSSKAWETLAQECDGLQWSDPGLGWPAVGTLKGTLRTHPITVYVRPLGKSGRKRPEERRFQNPGTKSKRAIHLADEGLTLLLGLWLEEGEDRAVVVSMDVQKRVGKETRFSMFVPTTTLQEAAERGRAQHKNSKGEVVTAVRVDQLSRYVDELAEVDRPALASAGPRPAYTSPAPDLPGINIRPRVGMYAAFARLNYKPWFAISEFIDNAVQSFLHHHEDLPGPLDVQVKIEDDEIYVVDRAAGIRLEDFPRAFSPSHPPPDNTGLSEFGLGMKAAACWFARRWSVKTSALGDPVERTISFDVPRITAEGIERLQPEERPAPPGAHYTVIRLHNLRNRPKGRTVSKIKEHLASIYRVLLADNTLTLRFTTPTGSEELSWEPPRLLKAPHFKDLKGPTLLWRKSFDFEVAPGRRIHGWAGILHKGSATKAGFSIFRRRRLIEGSVDRAYRPREIFRSPNSFSYQRITGEIHVEGFDVSHTKDGIQWGGLEDAMLQRLRLELDDKALPILRQAEGYRYRTRGSEVQKGYGEKALESVAAVLKEDSTSATLAEQSKPPVADEPDDVKPIETSVLTRSVTRRTMVVRVPTDHRPWTVVLELVSDPTKQWYEFGSEDNPKEQSIHVLINVAHAFSEHFLNDNEKVMTPLIRLVAGLALAEHTARLGRNRAGTVRQNLNQLLDGSLGTAVDKDDDAN